MNEGRKSFIRSGDKAKIYNHENRRLDATEQTEQREPTRKHPFAITPKKRGQNQRWLHYTQTIKGTE